MIAIKVTKPYLSFVCFSGSRKKTCVTLHFASHPDGNLHELPLKNMSNHQLHFVKSISIYCAFNVRKLRKIYGIHLAPARRL